MQSNLYLATTYLKLLCSNTALLAQLSEAFGDRFESVLADDLIRGADIDTVFSISAKQGLDSWILEYGDKIPIASHGPLGFAVLSAPDLRTAVQVLVDYSVIRSSIYRCELRHVENRVEFVTTDLTGSPLIGRWLIEADLLVTQRLVEAIMAHPLGDNAVVRFAYPEPSYADRLQTYLGIKCEFDAESNSLSMPASWCRISSPLSDPESFSTNLQKCRELKFALTDRKDTSEMTTLAFNRFFDARITGQTQASELPKLSQLASDNHCSPRTFARRLKQQGESYKSLLEACRRAYATRLLSTTHYSIAVIAELLAYQETANFVRAFKTWFDIPPATWRRQRAPTKLAK